MKNIFKLALLLFLVLSLILLTTNCGKSNAAILEEIFEIPDKNTDPVTIDGNLRNDIYFRNGVDKDGDIILTSIHIKDVIKKYHIPVYDDYHVYDDYSYINYILEFNFTDEGNQLFGEYINREISKNIETNSSSKISLWSGDKMLHSLWFIYDTPEVPFEIDGNSLLASDLNIDYIHYKLYDVEMPLEIAYYEILEEILNSMSMNMVDMNGNLVESNVMMSWIAPQSIGEDVLAGKQKIVSARYKNIEKSYIASKQDIIDLARNEIPDGYNSEITIRKITRYNLWDITFKNSSYSQFYSVIMSFDGITKLVLKGDISS